jgi:hypothetical protein
MQPVSEVMPEEHFVTCSKSTSCLSADAGRNCSLNDDVPKKRVSLGVVLEGLRRNISNGYTRAT